MPHLNYMLLAWGTKCHKIELLQKKGSSTTIFQVANSSYKTTI